MLAKRTEGRGSRMRVPHGRERSGQVAYAALPPTSRGCLPDSACFSFQPEKKTAQLTTFTIDTENPITAITPEETAAGIPDGATPLTPDTELERLAGDWPAEHLVAIWNEYCRRSGRWRGLPAGAWVWPGFGKRSSPWRGMASR